MLRAPWTKRLGLAAAVLLLMAGNAVALYTVLTSRYALMVFDFHPLWEAARELFLRGGDPYSDHVTLLVEQAKRGLEATAIGSDHTFAYPLPTLFVFLPVAWLPLPWAQAVWYTMLETALVVGVILGARGMGWRTPAWLLACAILWAVLVLPDAWALTLGQVSLLAFACLAGASWALRTGQDCWAGVLLTCSTIKPQLSLLVLPAVAVWAIVRRRWGVVKGLAGGVAFLYGFSFLLRPDWAGGFLYSLTRYAGHSPFVSPAVLAAQIVWPARSALLGAVLTGVLLLGWGGACWWSLRRERGVYWSIGMSLVVSLLIVPRTSIVNLVVLVLPLFLALAALPGPAGRRALLAAGCLLLIFVLIWGIDLLVLARLEIERAFAQYRSFGLLLPVTMGAVLVFGRERMAGRTNGT
jgi:hypothetical protein